MAKDKSDDLTSAAGISKQVLRRVWDDVQNNNLKLINCPDHRFVKVIQDLQIRYMCTECGGDIDSHAHYWYQHGLKHGINSIPHTTKST